MNKISDGKLAFAKIHIDIKNKRAIFDYPAGVSSGHRIILEIAAIGFIFWGLPLSLFQGIYNMSMNESITFKAEFLFIPPIVFALSVYIFHKDEMSKLAALFEKLLGHPEKRLHITEVSGRQYILPAFRNYMLDYKLYGEFAEQLLTIDIVPVKYGIEEKEKTKIYTWQAIFKFARKPKGGCMYLKFI